MNLKKTLLIGVTAGLLLGGGAIALAKYVMPGSGGGNNPYADFNISKQIGYAPGGPGSYGGPRRCGGSCCNSGGPANSADAQKRVEDGTKLAKDFYVSTYGDDPAITIQVKDFGCHMEAYVMKGDQMVKRLSINGNEVYELQG